MLLGHSYILFDEMMFRPLVCFVCVCVCVCVCVIGFSVLGPFPCVWLIGGSRGASPWLSLTTVVAVVCREGWCLLGLIPGGGAGVHDLLDEDGCQLSGKTCIPRSESEPWRVVPAVRMCEPLQEDTVQVIRVVSPCACFLCVVCKCQACLCHTPGFEGRVHALPLPSIAEGPGPL